MIHVFPSCLTFYTNTYRRIVETLHNLGSLLDRHGPIQTYEQVAEKTTTKEITRAVVNFVKLCFLRYATGLHLASARMICPPFHG
jgi:hypothetical protein